MSINQALEGAKADGRLVPFVPRTAWSKSPRAFLMVKGLWEMIEERRTHPELKVVERWAQLEADISFFVEGGLITQNHMKLLDRKHGHWELRSTRPKPSLRVFGQFAEPDVFFASHVVERKNLGGFTDLQWQMEMLECEDRWRQNLGNVSAFIGSVYEDYITHNATSSLGVQS